MNQLQFAQFAPAPPPDAQFHPMQPYTAPPPPFGAPTYSTYPPPPMAASAHFPPPSGSFGFSGGGTMIPGLGLGQTVPPSGQWNNGFAVQQPPPPLVTPASATYSHPPPLPNQSHPYSHNTIDLSRRSSAAGVTAGLATSAAVAAVAVAPISKPAHKQTELSEPMEEGELSDIYEPEDITLPVRKDSSRQAPFAQSNQDPVNYSSDAQAQAQADEDEHISRATAGGPLHPATLHRLPRVQNGHDRCWSGSYSPHLSPAGLRANKAPVGDRRKANGKCTCCQTG